jgi:hypothetical protein
MALNTARRLAIYGSAFLALFIALAALTGLLSLLSAPPADPGEFRELLSRYLATLVLALPIFLLAWSRAQRGARASEEERHAAERRSYLAAVFACAGLAALYSLSTLLQELLTMPDLGRQPARDAAIGLLVYGAAWRAFARVEWRERSPSAHNPPHDVAVFLLAGCALQLLLGGIISAVRQILTLLIAMAGSGIREVLPQLDRWTWGPIAGLILAGGLCWGALWSYDLRRGGRRKLREVYLYIVLLVCVTVALSHGLAGLYELIRRLLGYRSAPGMWDFLRWVLPETLVCGLAWAYHWAVLRQQPTADEAAAVHGTIAPACRPGLAALCWLGLTLAIIGILSLIWLALDALLLPGRHPAPDWWRDPLSIGLTLSLVGLAFWNATWRVLQRAAREYPRVERITSERRILLGAVVVTCALPGVGYAIATIWLILRAALGEGVSPDLIYSAAKYWCAAALLCALALTHATLLRRDLEYADAIARETPGEQ